MNRLVIGFVVSVIGLVLLLGYKTVAPSPARPALVAGAAPGAGSPTGAASSSPSAHAAPRRAAAPGRATRTVTGPVIQTPYGPVQVQITVRNGRLVDVRALQTPHDRGRSIAIAQYAVPILRREALAAQSANIDAVSGATYTSEGYAQSLQAALDAAHV